MAPAKWKTAALAVAIVGVGIFTLAFVSGLLYEQTQRARDREHYPQIGRSIDIGGRMLNIDCVGAGQPAVILESGANWALNSAVYDPKTIYANGGPRPGYSWVSIQRALATVTTVCWYDRAGSGWSDLGPYPRDSASQARDLHALLRAARIPPPYVLVGESSAALDARVYTGFYPTEVAGLVLVNWADPALFLELRSSNGQRAKRIPQLVYHSQDARGAVVQLRRSLPFGSSPACARAAQRTDGRGVEYHLVPDPLLQSDQRSHAGHLLLAAKFRRGAGSRESWRPATGRAQCREHRRAARIPGGLDERAERSRPTVHARKTGLGWRGASDLLYDAPDAIAEAVRQVVADVRIPNK